MSRARVIQVIETDDLRGRGTPDDPYRRVTQFWSFEGMLLMEDDSAEHTRKMYAALDDAADTRGELAALRSQKQESKE